MRNYVACQERLGYEPLDSDEIAAVEKSCEAMIERFGPPFDNQYGWAADQLKNKSPKFASIERAVGISHFRSHYQKASHNVHGNSKGVFFKLGLIEEMEILLAGPSIFGLADPGQSAAISLVQASAELALLHPTLDNVIILKIMHALEGEVGQAFIDAHQKLEDDVG